MTLDALHLARDGFRVIVTARQSQHDCEETARLVRDAGSDAAVHMADISDPARRQTQPRLDPQLLHGQNPRYQ